MAPGLPPIPTAGRQERSDAMRGAASGRRASNPRPSAWEARSKPSRGPAKLAFPRYGAESTPPTSAGFGRFRPACVATLLPPDELVDGAVVVCPRRVDPQEEVLEKRPLARRYLEQAVNEARPRAKVRIRATQALNRSSWNCAL